MEDVLNEEIVELTDETAAQVAEEVKEELALEELPFHKLRSLLKEEGIHFKTTDKKDALITMLRSGETAHVKEEKEQAPRMPDPSERVQAKVMLPSDISDQIKALEARGMKVEVNHDDGTVIFRGTVSTCANLDQSSRGILNTAKASMSRGVRPVEDGYRGHDSLGVQR